MKFLPLFFLFFLLQKTDLNAQAGFNFYRLHADNGLAQNSVWEVYQDYKGFLWIGTADGLNRWDGVNMHHYRPEPDYPHSIGGNTGFSFYEDSENQLWIFHNKGVSLYNRTFDRFQSVISSDSYHAQIGLLGSKILVTGKDCKVFEIDIHSLAVTPHLGLVKCTERPGFTSQHIKNNQLGDYIIYQPSSWVISIYNPIQKKTVCLTSQNPFSKLSKLTDTTCIAFSADSAIVFKLNKQTNRLFTERFPCVIMRDKVPTCATIHKNELWVGGEFGIYVLDSKNFEVRKYIPSIDPSVSQNEFIYGFYTDRAKNFYVLTNVAGLYVISPSSNRFEHFKTSWPEYNMVKSVVKTPDGKLITGQYRSSFAIYHPDGTVTAKRLFKNDGENSVFGLKNIDDCHILAVTSTRILSYNHCNDKIEKLYQYTEKPQTVYPSIQYNQGNYEMNLIGNTGSFLLNLYPDFRIDTICFFPQDIVTTYFRINEQQFLIGTDNELFVYNTTSGERSKSIVKAWIKSIIFTSQQHYIIATTNGIYVLNKGLNLLLHIALHNGLRDAFVYTVIEDHSGNYWLSHNKGLSCYDVGSQQFIHYDVQDGLQSNEFNTGAFYQHEDGSLYFGGVNGVNQINPNVIFKNSEPPQIAIHQIFVDDELFETDSAVNEISCLILPYYRNTISLDFSALDFSIPEKNRYAYFLSGVDKNWILSGTRHFLRYANLDPGRYSLFFKASNSDGVWSESRVLQIVIKPPFWKQSWFYVLEGLFIALIFILVVVFIRRRQKRAMQREIETRQRIEQERIRISRDLHDHVGAQLSYLISQLDWIAENPDEVGNKVVWNSKISTLSETGRNAMLTLRETIWAISHEELSVEEFADRFKQYVIKMTSMKSELQVDFHEDFSDPVYISPASALHVFRICQEAVHNSMKYSKADRLDIYFKSDGLTFTCTVSDNGIGFNMHQAGRSDSYGLQNMKERAEEAGAVFTIESVIGKGTIVTVCIPVYN